ncbi:hypothetical protein [Coralloluteibacterium thermophilus]
MLGESVRQAGQASVLQEFWGGLSKALAALLDFYRGKAACYCVRGALTGMFCPMHRTLVKLRSTIAALLVAVLVILPIADAFACSFESLDTHTAIALDDHASSPSDDAGKGDDSSNAHGVCAHGHCHHSTANVPSSTTVGYDAVRAVQAVSQDDPPASGISEGPLRPPRG